LSGYERIPFSLITVGYMLADMKMRIEACRYLTWKACQQFDRTQGTEHELAVMTKVFCSETCVDVVYDAMRVPSICEPPCHGLGREGLTELVNQS
jgi:hypothetical protein